MPNGINAENPSSKRRRQGAAFNVDQLLQLPPKEIERQLGCHVEQRQNALWIVSTMRFFLSRAFFDSDLVLDKIYLGGSLRKGTALNYMFDADIVLFIADFDKGKLGQYHEICVATFRDFLPKEFRYSMARSSRCTTVRFPHPSNLKVDLLMTGVPTSEHLRIRDSYYSPACSEDVDSMFCEFAKNVPVFRPFVLLCKHWRNSGNLGATLKSFHVEVLCREILTGKRAATMRSWLEEFLFCMAEDRCYVYNPNPCGYEIPSSFGEAARRHARETLLRIRGLPEGEVHVVRIEERYRPRERHILRYSKEELRQLGWDGMSQYFSHSQRRLAPFIEGYDSDSDNSYEELTYVPEDELDQGSQEKMMQALARLQEFGKEVEHVQELFDSVGNQV